MYNTMSGFEKYICMGVQVDGRLKVNQYQMKSWSKSATENQLYCILTFQILQLHESRFISPLLNLIFN